MNEPTPKPARRVHKSGRNSLSGGLSRIFPDHRVPLARAYRMEFRSLCASLSIDGDPLLRREAERVALLAVRARESSRLWAETSEKRRTGRGRKPSPQMLERSARRAALDDGTYLVALDRLRGLAARPVTPEDSIARARAAMHREHEEAERDGRV